MLILVSNESQFNILTEVYLGLNVIMHVSDVYEIIGSKELDSESKINENDINRSNEKSGGCLS